MRVTAWLALAVALAGCASGPPAAAPEATGPLVEGWVVDATRTPVPDAVASLAGLGIEAAVGDDGHYALQAPPGVDLVLVVAAPGFVPATRSVGAASGAHHVLNFSLERVPVAEPRVLVESHRGVLRCGAVATTMEDPARPHEHQGVRCSQLLNDTSNRWRYDVPANTSGMVVEAAWEAQSDVAQALVLKVVVEGSGETLGFIEGTSPLRVQLSSAKLAHELAAGHATLLMTLEPGAGTGNHEHGAVGVFVDQSFELYASTFYNMAVDPAYSFVRGS